jgi:hypothetical protein
MLVAALPSVLARVLRRRLLLLEDCLCAVLARASACLSAAAAASESHGADASQLPDSLPADLEAFVNACAQTCGGPAVGALPQARSSGPTAADQEQERAFQLLRAFVLRVLCAAQAASPPNPQGPREAAPGWLQPPAAAAFPESLPAREIVSSMVR